jgi:hypothetical protein
MGWSEIIAWTALGLGIVGRVGMSLWIRSRQRRDDRLCWRVRAWRDWQEPWREGGAMDGQLRGVSWLPTHHERGRDACTPN